jgi:drug/metabolite transporter (DMT)-like permease
MTVITSALFGLGAVLAKIVGEGFQPFFVSWLALFCGGICVTLCQLLLRKPILPRLTRTNWLDLLVLASIGTALPLVCIIVGLTQTSAITGSFLLQLQAPAAILGALFLLKEKMAWKQLGGIVLLLIGSLLVILRNLSGPLQIVGGTGDLFVSVGALGIGIAYIPAKRLTTSGDPLQIIILRLFLSSLFILPLLAFQPGALIAPLTWIMIGWLVLYIVGNFGLGYILQQASLGLLQAWEAAALMQTLPLFSTLFALLLLHESLTVLQIVGGCVILVGGFLVI